MSDAVTVLSHDARRDAPPCAAGVGDWARALLDRQLLMLGQLAEGGLRIAQAIERQATQAGAQEGPPAPNVVKGDVAQAYARVARAVRLTLMLQSKVIDDIRALEGKAEPEAAGAEADADAALSDRAWARKLRILRVTRSVAEAEYADDAVVERLVREGRERLDRDDLQGDLLSRPLGELVARICEGLGLSPDWPRLAEAAWAREEARAGKAKAPPPEPQDERFEIHWPPGGWPPVLFPPRVSSP